MTSIMVEAIDIPKGWSGVLSLTARPDFPDIWNSLRERGAVLDAGDGLFLVTRWAEGQTFLRDSRALAGSGTSEALGGSESPVDSVVRNWLMSRDGEGHRLSRGLVARLFTPRALADLERVIAAAADDLVERFVEQASAQQPVDFIAAIAQQLPSEVMRHLFAFSSDEWRPAAQALFDHALEEAVNPAAAVETMAPYLQEKALSGQHRDSGGIFDLLAREDRQGNRLSDAEVTANAVLLVTAGIDTTAGLLTNTLLELCRHPDAQKRVVEDFSLIPGCIDESLRYTPSAPSTTRFVGEDLTLGGRDIPAGSHLFLSIAAANRDPRQFEAPDEFRIERDCGQSLLTFGAGAHFCLGAALARMEARLIFEALFRRAHDFELAAPITWRTDNPVVRAPRHLLVTCRPRNASLKAAS
jgi:cytochrome P450